MSGAPAADEQAQLQSKLQQYLDSVPAKVQHYLDKLVPWMKARWSVTFGLLIAFFVRVFFAEGFYVVTYGLGIYMLNILINFLTPAVDPDQEEDGLQLPTKDGEQIFIRKLPEFKAWWSATKAIMSCMFMTLFSVFDLPVYWPILLAYFFFLAAITMKDRIKHMIKHKYVPFSIGKQTYGDLTKVQVPGAKAGGKDSK